RENKTTMSSTISEKILKYRSTKKDEDKTREELVEELEIMRKLARANCNSRIMLDEMYQFVALLDQQGNLLDVNEPALHGGGMIRSEIEGIPFWDCRWWAVSEKTQKDCKEAVYRAAEGQFVRYEVDIFGKSAGTETITIDFSLMPLFDEDGKVWLILPEGRNITEKKIAEDEIARKNNELRQLYEKIKELDELKTQFFANVSHELRTPLTLITHPTEMLMKDPSISQASKKYLDVIARNTRGLLKHVNNLLDISKLEAGKMTVQYSMEDIGRTINLIASCFELIARDNNLDYTIVTPSQDGPALMAAIDADKINRVVTNLISNAFKFTPRGGKIRVSVQRTDMPNGAPGFEVMVADTGPGVPEHLHSIIFDRFRQVDGTSSRKHGGTGLGLSIVKEFVELHKGFVTISAPKEGTGAIFSVIMPLSPDIEAMAHKTTVSDSNVSSLVSQPDDSAESGGVNHLQSMGSKFDASMIARQAAEELEQREGFIENFDEEMEDLHHMPKPTVLVVEDNVEMNRFIAELLASRYKIYTALDGLEGLEKLKQHTPDLIVTDCMMPNMSGDEMVGKIREMPEYDNIPIILLTAKADESMRVRLLNNGCSDYINKPFSSEELTARVSNAMAMKKAKQFLQEELKSANNDLGELVNQLATKKRELQVLVVELGKERALLDKANQHKDEFLMNLSHELRTPLNGILGWSQVLRYEHDIKELQHGLEAIERCAHAQNQLVNDLLDMSLIIGGKLQISPEHIDLSMMVTSAVETLQLQAKSKKITLSTDLESLNIRGDPVRLQQCVWNMLSNGIKFSREGGSVSVKLTRSDGANIPGVCSLPAEKARELLGQAKTAWSLLTITDTGKGISADFLPHVFDRFRQADCSSTRTYGGLGLGLSIVSNIVELHGGIAYAHSKGEGMGSQFSLLLPLDQENLKRPRATFEESCTLEQTNTLNGLRFMVVDDLEETVQLIAKMLTTQGSKSITTHVTVKDAMEALQKGDAKFDAILSDLTMPNEDGYSFIAKIRQWESSNNLPRTPVVALTAAASISDRFKVQSCGFDDHIAKPVNLLGLTNVILKLIHKQQSGNNNNNNNVSNSNGTNGNHNGNNDGQQQTKK
ncbi:hypothetical protein SAMD00019534_027010, partial [Acytostelium subglobosum LB1]|uniref:hypothetical protein n=1 Tax=Acytostelium subglobosum LB1 TaxID=1410327 RepID=UPI0006447C54